MNAVLPTSVGLGADYYGPCGWDTITQSSSHTEVVLLRNKRTMTRDEFVAHGNTLLTRPEKNTSATPTLWRHHPLLLSAVLM